jgi:hypothetical protein
MEVPGARHRRGAGRRELKTLPWRSTVTLGVTGRGTGGVTVRVTVSRRFLRCLAR